MTVPRPHGSNFLVVILGASDFPDFKSLTPSQTFSASADAFVRYLTSAIQIPETNILSLFDDPHDPGTQIRRIRRFLRDRLLDISVITDVIIYYCGHGEMITEDEYVLALRSTDSDSKEATVFKVSYIVDIIGDLTRDKRNLVILDACYSGAALGKFIKMSEEHAVKTVTQEFFSSVPNPEDDHGDDPDSAEGSVLFCAAGPRKQAKSPVGGTYTMFSGALKEVLEEGDPKSGPDLTLKRLAQLIDKKIWRAYGNDAVKPQIHVPIQGRSDLLNTPYFPNSAFLPATAQTSTKVFTQTARSPSSHAEMTSDGAAAASPGETASVSPSPSFHAPDANSRTSRAIKWRSITLGAVIVVLVGLSIFFLSLPQLTACSDPSVRSQVAALLNTKGFKGGIGSSYVGGLACFADVKGTHKTYMYLPYGAFGYYHVVEDDSVNAPNPN